MRTATGLDVLAREGFSRLAGKSLGVLCNQSSVTADLEHVLDLLLARQRAGTLRVRAAFGPQHGLFGHTQDNMIEWRGADEDARMGIPVHSLYGEHREPTDAMLDGIDLMLIDVPDVGARYYTFVWSMANTMAACARNGIPVLVLDRPNPIGGIQVEGTVLRPGFESFVGAYPLPTRHGMTVAEIAHYLRGHFLQKCDLSAVTMEGWSRSDYFDDTDLPWTPPSPNIPTVDTAVVYPGGCLLEATNLSEGRGTTRPFEIVGAPFLDGWKMAEALGREALPGVRFRAVQFEPTSNKHAGRLCGGVFVHVSDRRAFEPVLTYVAILRAATAQTGVRDTSGLPTDEVFRAQSAETELDGFAWRRPPYEYERERSPFDILAGNEWLREEIERDTPLKEIRERFLRECAEFDPLRREAILYPSP